MSNNYETYGYENNNYQKRSSLLKRLLIILLVIVSIILVLFLIKRCSNPTTRIKPQVVKFDYETHLVEAGKKYFENNYDKYPKEIGKCEEIELQGLIDRNLLNASDYSKCNTSRTYVKVCMLENKSYHYSPWLVCSDESSNETYEVEKVGSLVDVKADKTMVNFKFIPQVLVSGQTIYGNEEEIWKDEIKYTSYKTLASTEYYRYKDELFIWKITDKKYYTRSGEKTNANDVKEYYLTSPDSNYKVKDEGVTGYKWFTTSSKKTYASDSNGRKIESHSYINGYPYSEVVSCKQYQTRTLTGSTEPYHYYKCAKSKNATYYIYQYNKPCGSAPNTAYSYELDNLYTCGHVNDVDIESKRVASSSVKCKTYSDWKYISGTCDTSLPTCRKTDSYCSYYWYKLETDAIKKYYPSMSSSADKEKVYYLNAPVSGASKDESTKATVYKWYKALTRQVGDYSATPPEKGATKTNISKWTEWTEYSLKNPKASDGRNRKIETRTKIKLKEIKGTTADSYKDLSDIYLTEEELIDLLKSKNYSVSSLSDITNNGELKLKIQMLIRNKKESK